MPKVELSAGTIEYEDSGARSGGPGTGAGDGGDGGPAGEGVPTLVLLHGLTMDGSVWQPVLDQLGPGYRVVRPTLPLGAHRIPMHPEADLSLRGIALLVGEFLDKLDLRDVTLVLNDWGGAQILLAEGRTERIGKLVLTACEAFDNYPPGLPGRSITAVVRVPGALRLLLAGMRFRAVRRAPGGWGWMSKRPVPKGLMDAWFEPARTQPEIRRDLAKYVLSTPGSQTLLDWSERMRTFDRPVLVVWAKEDRMMPRAHGPRLARLFPDARLVELDDTYTLIPLDRPARLAALLREFTTGGAK